MALRVGIVGSGFGGTVHAPAYRLHPLYEVVAIASPRSASRVAGELGIPHAFPSVEAMLAGAGDSLDVVSVAAPPAEHHRAVMAAIAAGKHVLCEKPFALTLAQAAEMTAAARAAGVAGALAFEFRFAPPVQTMRRLVREGQLPRLREVEIVRWGSELVATSRRPPSSWWYDGAQGGGIANAFMPHLVDLACFLTGRTPLASAGFVRTANPQRTAPDGTAYANTASDGAFALVDLGEGLIGKVTADGTRARNRCVYALAGETHRLVASGPDMLDLRLVLGDAENAGEIPSDPARHPEAAGERPNIRLFLSLLDEFARFVGGHAHDCPTFADGLAVQRVLDAIGYGRPAPA
jgi:predicted dehydrogenase